MSVILTRKDGSTVRLGRVAPKVPNPLWLDDPKFGLNLAAFGVVPASIDYGTNPAVLALMADLLGNDEHSNCTTADLYKRQGLWQAASDKPVYHPSLSVVLDTFTRDGGEPGDVGCDETVVQTNHVEAGIPDSDHGTVNKAAGYVQIDSQNAPLVQAALTAFGGLSANGNLPDAISDSPPVTPGYTFDVSGPPDPQHAHCWTLTGQNTKSLRASLWGVAGDYTYDACATYNAEAQGGALYATLDEEILVSAIGAAPDGLDWAALIVAIQTAGALVLNPQGLTWLERIEKRLGRRL